MLTTAKRGRKATTGRFDTREILCAFVWHLYLNTPIKPTIIALRAKVPTGTVCRILNKREGHPDEVRAAALAANAAEVAVLFKSYDRAGWWIDRMGQMEFLDDQLTGAGVTFQPEFYQSTFRDFDRLNFHGYII